MIPLIIQFIGFLPVTCIVVTTLITQNMVYICPFFFSLRFMLELRCFIFKVFNVTVLKFIVCVFSCASVEVFIEFVFCLEFLPQNTVNICCELLVSSITLYMYSKGMKMRSLGTVV